MGRINGANSDYVFQNSENAVVNLYQQALDASQPPPSLEMRLFICPNNQKSTVEAEGSTCEGVSGSCPHPNKNDHAMVQLHQDNGITLQTDSNTLNLDQAGTTLIDATNIHLQASNQVQMFDLTVSKSGSNHIVMNVGVNRLTIQTATGAKIEFTNAGDINITPKAGRSVNVNGTPF